MHNIMVTVGGRHALVRVQATLKWLALILTGRPIVPRPGRFGLDWLPSTCSH